MNDVVRGRVGGRAGAVIGWAACNGWVVLIAGGCDSREGRIVCLCGRVGMWPCVCDSVGPCICVYVCVCVGVCVCGLTCVCINVYV